MNELTDRVEKLEAELAQLKNSGAFLVGTALLAIAKDPRRSLVAVRNLVRLWRQRGEVVDRQFSTELGEPMLQRVRTPTKFNFGPRIAVIGTSAFIDELASTCCVLALMPHDRDLADVLLPFKPQVLIIEAKAGTHSDIWQHLGNPLAPDRAAQLARIVNSASRNSIPVIFWANAPRKIWEHAVVDLQLDQIVTAEKFEMSIIKALVSND
jgi:hypothetical protein